MSLLGKGVTKSDLRTRAEPPVIPQNNLGLIGKEDVSHFGNMHEDYNRSQRRRLVLSLRGFEIPCEMHAVSGIYANEFLLFLHAPVFAMLLYRMFGN